MVHNQDKRKAWLALGAALAFLVAAVIEAAVALTKHQTVQYSAAGLGAAALLWLLVYWMWSKRG